MTGLRYPREFVDWLTRAFLPPSFFAPNNDALGGMVHLGKHALAILNDLDKFGATLDDSSQHARIRCGIGFRSRDAFLHC